MRKHERGNIMERKNNESGIGERNYEITYKSRPWVKKKNITRITPAIFSPKRTSQCVVIIAMC